MEVNDPTFQMAIYEGTQKRCEEIQAEILGVQKDLKLSIEPSARFKTKQALFLNATLDSYDLWKYLMAHYQDKKVRKAKGKKSDTTN